MNEYEYVSKALLKVWFPKSHNDQSWLNSDDGRNWSEIADADAAVAIKALREWEQSQ